MFEKRLKTPVEERDYSVYYIVFSGLLFLGTMWAVVDEVATRRPWKEYQREYSRILREKVNEQLEFAQMYTDSASLLELQDELRAVTDSMKSPEYQDLVANQRTVLERLVDVNREFQFAKSRGDEAYYFYKKSLREGDEDLSEKAILEENEATMAERQSELNVLEARRDSFQLVIDGYRKRQRSIQIGISDVLEDVDKWEGKLKTLDDAVIEIKQVIMLDYDRTPFNDPKARVDRCQSCHLGWKEELAEDLPQPFTLHPVPELLSLHDPEKFGCTPCHRGQGNALTAGFAHGDDDHYWEYPILEGKRVWSSCSECHENQSDLQYAPEFTHSKRLMIEAGCHGCHEIKGYTDLAKIGPELNRIGHKTTPEWIFSWIKNPKEYNPHTRMPNFMFSDDQAEAVTAFLMDLSDNSGFETVSGDPGPGNVDRGRSLVETVGCMACHTIGEQTKVRETRGTSYDIAPELTRVGSKVSRTWAFDWVRNPRHYNPTTKMPSLRLTDGEARDIVSYLMTLTDPNEREPIQLDLHSPDLVAKGKKLVREYGCFGCHLINGMENESRVSVSLSNFGRKRVDEMDFGDTHVPHTWEDWVTNKLKNSRVFATDRIQQKMPVFSFSDDEISLLKRFLLSQTKDVPDQKYVQVYDAKQKNIEKGRRLTYQYNCQQCHRLEEKGGYVAAILEDAAFQPPPITGEGAKVQEPWLHDFLRAPSRVGQPNAIRPWISVRMPTFGLNEDEINDVMKYFLALSNQEFELRDYGTFRPDPELVGVGRGIFNDFQCSKCHPTGNVVIGKGELSTQDLAPDLTKARGRLKPAWIVDWLADPGKIQEGTRMPTFFPDGQSPLPEVLDGDATKQMVAIRDYLMTIGRPAPPVAGMP